MIQRGGGREDKSTPLLPLKAVVVVVKSLVRGCCCEDVVGVKETLRRVPVIDTDAAEADAAARVRAHDVAAVAALKWLLLLLLLLQFHFFALGL